MTGWRRASSSYDASGIYLLSQVQFPETERKACCLWAPSKRVLFAVACVWGLRHVTVLLWQCWFPVCPVGYGTPNTLVWIKCVCKWGGVGGGGFQVSLQYFWHILIVEFSMSNYIWGFPTEWISMNFPVVCDNRIMIILFQIQTDLLVNPFKWKNKKTLDCEFKLWKGKIQWNLTGNGKLSALLPSLRKMYYIY